MSRQYPEFPWVAHDASVAAVDPLTGIVRDGSGNRKDNCNGRRSARERHDQQPSNEQHDPPVAGKWRLVSNQGLGILAAMPEFRLKP